ncbi:hypothetical protein ACTWQB_16870 [Piscibacillus sp. B03]|uniref:hypothetical protein n=1 Tax=Piscibacillus sp. B03 TaxID=3457430 RepID=UPI003FCD4BC9
MYRIKFWENVERREMGLSDLDAYDYTELDEAVTRCEKVARMFEAAEVVDQHDNVYFYAGWKGETFETFFTEKGEREQLISRNLKINSFPRPHFEEWTNAELQRRLDLLEKTFDELIGEKPI